MAGADLDSLGLGVEELQKNLVSDAEWAKELVLRFGSRYFTKDQADLLLALLELEKRGLVRRRGSGARTEWRATKKALALQSRSKT